MAVHQFAQVFTCRPKRGEPFTIEVGDYAGQGFVAVQQEASRVVGRHGAGDSDDVTTFLTCTFSFRRWHDNRHNLVRLLLLLLTLFPPRPSLSNDTR